MSDFAGGRLAVYCDYPYRVADGRLSAEQPVALFFAQLAGRVESLTMIGRLDSSPGSYPYVLESARLVALPHYDSGAAIGSLVRQLPVSLRRFWRMLVDVDVVWVFGPTMMAPLFALLTLARRRRLVLGVRQDMPRLFAHRYPDRRLLRLEVAVLEGCFRALSRIAPAAVVGPELARSYRHAVAIHEMYVSLLHEADIAPSGTGEQDYEGPELRMLSVGRLDPEKNPLLLADVLAGALERDPRWRLDVCGDGPLTDALARRLAEMGIADKAVLHGHVPVDDGLLDLYRDAHSFIHVSFSEGVPQVLLECFAMQLPVVATAVGGVREVVGDAALLVGPDDAPAAVAALHRVATEPTTRAELVARGLALARAHTCDAETMRAAHFVLGSRIGGEQ